MARPATALEEIRDLASDASRLLHELPDLLGGNHLNDGFDFSLLEAALDAWSNLLSDSNLQTLYASEMSEPPVARRSFPPPGLSNVRGYLYAVRQELMAGNFQLAGSNAKRLLVEFHELVRRLQRMDFRFSSRLQDTVVRHEFTARMTAAEELQRQAEELLASTQDYATKASKAADSASEAAGTAGESIMASYFEDFSKQEWESATKFRVWTIVLLSVGGALAVVFLLLPAFGIAALALDAGDYVHLAQRVIVTAAMFAIAAYLARQSHQHRTLANWAKALSVQLKTFDAFMAPLDSNEAKEALRAQFAARVFGEPPVLRGESTSGDSSPVPQQLWDVLSRNMGKPQ